MFSALLDVKTSFGAALGLVAAVVGNLLVQRACCEMREESAQITGCHCPQAFTATPLYPPAFAFPLLTGQTPAPEQVGSNDTRSEPDWHLMGENLQGEGESEARPTKEGPTGMGRSWKTARIPALGNHVMWSKGGYASCKGAAVQRYIPSKRRILARFKWQAELSQALRPVRARQIPSFSPSFRPIRRPDPC